LIFEGGGKVCSTADSAQWNSMWKNNTAATHTPKIGNQDCTYYEDALWSGGTAIATDAQGLYLPTLGPPATKGAFTFNAGPNLEPPASYCISSIGGDGCSLLSAGELHPSDVGGTGEPGLGVYAGSSLGRGYSETTPAGGGTPTRSNFGWDQSGATILPITGTTTTGGTLAGFTSSRPIAGCSNCGSGGVQGEDNPTTIFAVEGMFVYAESS
jgi:hypothetical protein